MNIPDKLFFKIGEAATITNLEPYVLRYWETEFKALSPGKSKTGIRLYQRTDISLILEIKRLLYEEKFSIEGAKRKLEKRIKICNNDSISTLQQKTLERLKQELQTVHTILKG